MPLPASLPTARGSLRLGLAVLALFLAGMVAAAGWVRVDGAIILQGRFEPGTAPVAVQAPEPAVIASMQVDRGDVVRQGDLLVEFVDRELQVERETVLRERFDIALRRAMFTAERDGRRDLAPQCCRAEGFLDTVWAQSRIAETRELHALRLAGYEADRDVLGVRAQEAVLRRQRLLAEGDVLRRRSALIEREARALGQLDAAGLALAARRGAMEREALEIEAALARNAAEVAAADLAESAALQEATALSAARRRTAAEALADLSHAIEAADARLEILDLRLARTRVLAPVDGTVADPPPDPGAVVAAGQVLFRLVPDAAALRVVAPLDPRNMDDVWIGQGTRLRLTALPGTTMPELPGVVSGISPLPRRDQGKPAVYYEVFIAPDAAALARLPAPGLSPEMPVEVFLTTGARTPLSLLSRALSDYFARALRAG